MWVTVWQVYCKIDYLRKRRKKTIYTSEGKTDMGFVGFFFNCRHQLTLLILSNFLSNKNMILIAIVFHFNFLKKRDHSTILSRKFLTCLSHIYFSFNNKNCFKNTLIGNTYAYIKNTVISLYISCDKDTDKWSCMLRFSGLVLAISVLTASLWLDIFVWILVVLLKRIIHI